MVAQRLFDSAHSARAIDVAVPVALYRFAFVQIDGALAARFCGVFCVGVIAGHLRFDGVFDACVVVFGVGDWRPVGLIGSGLYRVYFVVIRHKKTPCADCGETRAMLS